MECGAFAGLNAVRAPSDDVEPDKAIYMVSQGRFELPAFPLGGGCSIQLSY